MWFFLFSFVALASALLMIIQSRPLYSALFFVLTILAVAALILLQQAYFLAFALVIIYAGAVLVVYVFVLMLSRQENQPAYDTKAHTPLLATIIGLVFFVSVLQLMFTSSGGITSPEATGELTQSLTETGTASAIGRELFDRHVVALEVAGLILVIAAVGGIALIKNLKPKPNE